MVEREVTTGKGTIRLIRELDPGIISGLHMGEGLGIFFHYRYEDAHKTKEVLSALCTGGRERVACAVSGESLIGYATAVPPEKGSKWETIDRTLHQYAAGLTLPILMELGSIEISKPWRSQGLARQLLRFMLEDGYFDGKIMFSRELSWHWDLKSSGLSAYEYRSMLLKLFEGVGFRYCETDDEEIAYSGENMLMVRVGPGVPDEAVLAFYRSVCRPEPRGWGWG